MKSHIVTLADVLELVVALVKESGWFVIGLLDHSLAVRVFVFDDVHTAL
jgi:hypothetical protein